KSLLSLEMDAAAYADDKSKALLSYRHAVSSSTIGQDLLDKQVPFRWTGIEFLSDPASKLGTNDNADDYLVHQLRDRLGEPQERFSIISSYFVPTKDGVNTLIALAKSGVDVRILTNSYDATDVGIVHAGYAHWRQMLLANGIRIFELKSTAKNSDAEHNKLRRTPRQTTTSLHAKAFAVDDYKVFIGSYNVDPRSANINTEMGVVIYDNSLAKRLHNALDDSLLSQAYEVKLDNGRLQWHTVENGRILILTSEPNMQISDRFAITLMGLMPIDWLL
ncbi:MAG: phospholipase D-like domain-containing protein, partial [Moraxella sp.]|nr:phospholipase D-like domain-containing protein [Moraxella sp.]